MGAWRLEVKKDVKTNVRTMMSIMAEKKNHVPCLVLYTCHEWLLLCGLGLWPLPELTALIKSLMYFLQLNAKTRRSKESFKNSKNNVNQVHVCEA